MNRFPMFLLIIGLFHISELIAAPSNIGVLVLSENPVRLIRATTLYQAPVGTRLQAMDFLESDQTNIQIDELAGMRVGLGPHTSIYLKRSGTAIQIILLSGWIKLQPIQSANNESLIVNTATLTLDANRSASVIHASDTRVEVFVEDGTLALIEHDDKVDQGRRSTLTHEEYAERMSNKNLSSPGRPDSNFIGAMPRDFFDHLPIISVKKLPVLPLKVVRDVTFDDVSPLLLGLKPDARLFATRFSPRLSDPAFRQAITQNFGGMLEWETELYRFERKFRAR